MQPLHSFFGLRVKDPLFWGPYPFESDRPGSQRIIYHFSHNPALLPYGYKYSLFQVLDLVILSLVSYFKVCLSLTGWCENYYCGRRQEQVSPSISCMNGLSHSPCMQ